jgi:hypothetical protein
MNILCTTVGPLGYDFQYEHMISEWRARHHIVETMPSDRLTGYLRFDLASSHAAIDVIVCHAAVTEGFGYSFLLSRALKLAAAVNGLPESCAMRDGRKWRTLPFIILNDSVSDFEATDELKSTHAQLIRVSPYPDVVLRRVEHVVDEYLQRIMDDYESLGLLVRFRKGHAQIGPAMQRKRPDLESAYYYAPSDRRNNRGWVTVVRDSDGLHADVEMFQQLLDRKVNEMEMQKFFEEHPALLMQARLGIPIPHPRYAKPIDWSPDFAVSSVLGPIDGKVELLELKGPAERLLNNRAHRGFSAKVKEAIDQVRDYDYYLRHPDNRETIYRQLGQVPSQSKLAVLIGRATCDDSGNDIAKRRQAEIDVQIITYDEIFEKQAGQLSRKMHVIMPPDLTL